MSHIKVSVKYINIYVCAYDKDIFVYENKNTFVLFH